MPLQELLLSRRKLFMLTPVLRKLHWSPDKMESISKYSCCLAPADRLHHITGSRPIRFSSQILLCIPKTFLEDIRKTSQVFRPLFQNYGTNYPYQLEHQELYQYLKRSWRFICLKVPLVNNHSSNFLFNFYSISFLLIWNLSIIE